MSHEPRCPFPEAGVMLNDPFGRGQEEPPRILSHWSRVSASIARYDNPSIENLEWNVIDSSEDTLYEPQPRHPGQHFRSKKLWPGKNHHCVNRREKRFETLPAENARCRNVREAGKSLENCLV